MSDGDANPATNTNVMRHDQMKIIKDFGLAFIQKCDNLGSSRELSLAKTKVEEAVFWAVKHLTK